MGARNGRKIDKEVAPNLSARIKLRVADDRAVNDYPNLTECLYPLFDREGRMVREGGTITISVDGSLYRVSITMPTERVQTRLATDSLIGILDTIERHLASTTDWVPVWKAKQEARNRLKRS